MHTGRVSITPYLDIVDRDVAFHQLHQGKIISEVLCLALHMHRGVMLALHMHHRAMLKGSHHDGLRAPAADNSHAYAIGI